MSKLELEYWQNMADSLRRENQKLTSQVEVLEKAFKIITTDYLYRAGHTEEDECFQKDLQSTMNMALELAGKSNDGETSSRRANKNN